MKIAATNRTAKQRGRRRPLYAGNVFGISRDPGSEKRKRSITLYMHDDDKARYQITISAGEAEMISAYVDFLNGGEAPALFGSHMEAQPDDPDDRAPCRVCGKKIGDAEHDDNIGRCEGCASALDEAGDEGTSCR